MILNQRNTSLASGLKQPDIPEQNYDSSEERQPDPPANTGPLSHP